MRNIGIAFLFLLAAVGCGKSHDLKTADGGTFECRPGEAESACYTRYEQEMRSTSQVRIATSGANDLAARSGALQRIYTRCQEIEQKLQEMKAQSAPPLVQATSEVTVTVETVPPPPTNGPAVKLFEHVGP